MKSIQLSENEADKLEVYLSKNNVKFTKVKSSYEKLRVKDIGINLILYKSLKLVFNESDFMNKIFNEILIKEDYYDYIIGSDETGKGEWYGPLVVVAVALKPDDIDYYRKIGVKDSKLLKIDRIVELADEVLNKRNFLFHKVILRPEIYNDMYIKFTKENKNLNDLMAWAHSAAIKDLLGKTGYENSFLKIIIDKFDFRKTDFRLETIKARNITIIQKSKGESEIPVALASIIAKYFFEKIVRELNHTYKINLKIQNPSDLSKQLLYQVAKIHFKNVPF